MHAKVIVLGPDPEMQLRDAIPSVDWCAIGGRYTGHLATVPGATSGRAFGDAVPSTEAHLADPLGAHVGGGVKLIRPASRGPGVDQARCADLDLDESWLACATLVDHGTGHGDPYDAAGLTADELAAHMAASLGSLPSLVTPEDNEALASACVKLEAWNANVRRIICVTDPDALVTVVDAHL